MADFIFLGSKISADGDCSHEIKRHLLLERKVMTNLVFLPEESQGRGAWWAAIYGVAQSRTRLKSLSAVILEPTKIKSDTVSTVSPSICHELMGPDAMIFVF